MRIHIFLVLLLGIAIGDAAVPGQPMQAPVEIVQIDFIGLHDQASSALQILQASQERRIALQQSAEAAF